MKKCLIVLTADYPFTVGEPFLESEMPYHSENFDKIIILTLEKSPDAVLTRELPANAQAYNVSTINPKLVRAFSALGGGLAAVFNKTKLSDSDSKSVGRSFSKRAFTEYFENRANKKFNDCKKILDKIDFSAYDSVTVYSYWYFITCRVGVYIKDYLKSKGKNAVLVSRAHRYDIYESVNSLNFLPCRELLAANTDKVFACSDDGTQHLKSVSPNFFDEFKTSYLGTVDGGVGAYPDSFHILTCSRTVPVKRLERLVDSLELLKNSGADICWTHIGDGSEQAKITALANQKLSFMHFEFLGQLSNKEVSEYYKSNPISLFINISSSEGLPVSIMEASSFGIPVLATDVGGTSEIVIDSYNGLLLDKDFDNQALADKILEFYKMNGEEYKTFRNNAREHWEKNFDCNKNYAGFSTEISNLI